MIRCCACGRYTLASPGELVAELLELETAPALTPRYNIAPTQESAVLRVRDGGRRLDALRWGLVPYWAAEPGIGNRLINARSETAGEKPSFRDSLRRRRCLVAADGFYEWRRHGRAKQPWLIRRPDGLPFAFAGLWDRWVPHDGEVIESFTILTTRPNELLAPLHDRMPVILPPREHARWLDPAERAPERLAPLLGPLPSGELEAFPVGTLVNSPANDEPRCVEPLPGWADDPAFDL